MRCDSPCPMYRVLTDSIKPQVPTDFYHTMPKPMRDKIHHSWITSNDYFKKQISFVFKPKTFWMFTLMIICFQKSMCLLWVANFLGSHRRLRKPSHTFTGFHRWIHMCNQKESFHLTHNLIFHFQIMQLNLDLVPFF